MNLLLRRNKNGLASLRKINSLMESNTLIRNDKTKLPNIVNYTFNWGYVRKLPNYSSVVLNKPINVGISSSKGTFRKKLYDNGLTMRTSTSYNEIKDLIQGGGKWLLRENNHFGGKNIYVIETLHDLLNHYEYGMYLSEFIDKEKEFRVFVTQGRVVFVVEKLVEDKTSVAWNVHAGGRFENVRRGDWNLKVLDYAIKAVLLAGLDYGAVDVMIKGDDVYVLEVNTSPTMQEDYWTSCVAKSFDYIIKNGNNTIPVVRDSGWRGYLHPSLHDEVIL